MLRLFSTHGLNELRKCSHLVAFGVTKRKVIRFLPVSSASHHRLHILARHFSSGSSVWKDALQPNGDEPKEMQTVDLDKWKSVMRSQAATEEKQVNEEDEASDDDENLNEPGGDLKGSSLLEATRELITMWQQAGKLVPEEITDEELQTVAELPTKSARRKYLKYLALREGYRKARKMRQQLRKAEKEEKNNEREENDQSPLEPKNCAFLYQFWRRSLDKLLGWKCAQSMVFGQPLVFDMSYESDMSRQELQSAVSQLMEAEGWNRRSIEPFHLHYCNLKPDGAYKQLLLKRYGAEIWDRLLITSTDQHYVNVFPREQLVYLTADSPNVLRTYDHSKVYIVGALVDRSIRTGLSMANAKCLKLSTARLPLDEFLHWEKGAKNLTLDQMLRIMLALKQTGKWEEALKYVPRRKHDGFQQRQTQKEITNARVSGVTNYGPREDSDGWLRSGEKSFKIEGQSVYMPFKKPGFTRRVRMAGLPGDRENKPAATRVSGLFKNNTEGRKGASKSKVRWDDE